MTTFKRPRRVVVLALGLVAIAFAVAGIAYASIPSANGVIHGCYKTNQGTLRVIDTEQGQACSNSEAPLDWNQRGVTGPQGVQGPPGPQGQQGEKGDPGPTYSAGTGLSLSGTTFGIQGSYQLPQGCSSGQSPFLLGFPASHPWSCFTAANAGESCSSSKFVNGINSDGDITCGTPSSGGSSLPAIWVTRNLGDQDTPEQLDTTVATLSLPAGSFLLTGEGFAAGDTLDNDINLGCHFDAGSGADGSTTADVEFDSFSVNDVAVLASPADVHLVCKSGDPHTHVEGVVMTALQVGTVNTQ